jgi:hypothetical protein
VLKLLQDKTLEWWIEWTSTVVLIVGVALTAWNIYPLNAVICLLGNLGWFGVALYWRKWSLGIVQIIVSMIYVAGLSSHYFFK